MMKQLETRNSRVPLSESGESVDCGKATALEEGSHCQTLSLKQGSNEEVPTSLFLPSYLLWIVPWVKMN